jgi:hypothetical protein
LHFMQLTMYIYEEHAVYFIKAAEQSKFHWFKSNRNFNNDDRMTGSSEHGETSKALLSRGVSKGISVLDLILRFIAIIGTLASAIAMGTINEMLPFFTQFI